MALFTLATISGMETVFGSTLNSAVASGLVSTAPYVASLMFWTAGTGGAAAVTRLSYDPAEDAVIVTNGLNQNPTYVYPNYLYAANSAVATTGIVRPPLTHVVIPGGSLDPAGPLGSGGSLSVLGASIQYFPGSGGSYGFAIDPNTNTNYQVFWHFFAAGARGGGTWLPYGYGTTRMVSTTASTYAGGFHWQALWDGTVTGEQAVASGMVDTVARPGRLYFAPGFYLPPLPPVVFDDVVVFVYADLIGTAWVSCRARPATGASAWRGTRSMPFGWPMALAPMGVDRCIAVWWAYPRAGAPLVYTVFRYDRALAVLRLEDIGTVPTTRTYTYPQHMGYATYDRRRGHLVLLSPNPNDFDQYTPDQFCHPGVPRALVGAVPLDPTHAGYAQRYAVATYTDASILAAGQVTVSYPGFASTDTSRATLTLATEGPTGTGTFAVSWTSGASGVSGILVLGTSSYSVGLSATYSQGLAYGTEGMALITSTANFTVSTTLSAATATSLVAAVVIMPRVPVSQSDMVGAGSPRLLSYPTSALATPTLYPINPQVWTNFLANPLLRPLYASTRTLQKTATVAFTGDVTDIEVTEKWLGGGNRIAMPLSFFAALVDLFQNPPDLASAGFITWEPRDISSRKYKVLITNLTVGGSEMEMDNLIKTGDGWVHSEVALTMKLISEV